MILVWSSCTTDPIESHDRIAIPTEAGHLVPLIDIATLAATQVQHRHTGGEVSPRQVDEGGFNPIVQIAQMEYLGEVSRFLHVILMARQVNHVAHC